MYNKESIKKWRAKNRDSYNAYLKKVMQKRRWKGKLCINKDTNNVLTNKEECINNVLTKEDVLTKPKEKKVYTGFISPLKG